MHPFGFGIRLENAFQGLDGFLIYDSRCDPPNLKLRICTSTTYHRLRLELMNLKCHLPKGARVFAPL